MSPSLTDYLRGIALVALAVGLFWSMYRIDVDVKEGIAIAKEKQEEYLLKQKNRVYDIVKLEYLDGRVKSIKSENGLVFVTLEEVADLGEVVVPTYDASSLKLQSVVNFYYCSIVRSNKDYRRGFILQDDYNDIHQVNDAHGVLMYNIFDYYFPQEHKEY